MRRRRRRRVHVLAALVCLAGTWASGAGAQDGSDSAAYRALTQTPVSALPPDFDVGITGERGNGVAVQARYGIVTFDTHLYIHNFGLGVSVPAGGTNLNATVGYYMPRCGVKVCHSHVMGSAGLSENLASIALGNGSKASTFDIGLQGSFGFAHPSDTTLASGALFVPFSLVPAPRGLRLVPYVSPGVGLGLVRDDSGTTAGLLFLFDAGLGLILRDVRINLSLSRAFLPDGNWVAGVGVRIGGH